MVAVAGLDSMRLICEGVGWLRDGAHTGTGIVAIGSIIPADGVSVSSMLAPFVELS